MPEPQPEGPIADALAELAQELERPEADAAVIRRRISELADLFLAASPAEPPDAAPTGVAAPDTPG